MDHLLISSDSHVAEPLDLWTSHLPEEMRAQGPRVEMRDGTVCMMVEDTIIRKFKVGGPNFGPGGSARTGGDAGAMTRAADTEERSGMASMGASDPDVRLADLDRDGVWGEVIFPNLAFFCGYRIESPQLQVEVCRLYNDWLADTFIGASDRFCPVGLLPVLDVEASTAELERMERRGFRAALMPSHVDVRPLNDPAYEPLWATAEGLDMPLCFHAGTGRSQTPAHGPGGAVVNYVVTVSGPMETATYLCASGVLARHPGLRVVMVECGSGWLAWALHAMDDAYREHHMFVNPKLDDLPSEYFRRQGAVTFQNDPVGFATRQFTGDRCLLWGSDYPHPEGTFPESHDYLARQLEGVPADVARRVTLDNAAELFRFRLPAAAASPVTAVPGGSRA